MKRDQKRRSPWLRAMAVLLAMAMLFTSSGFQVLAQETGTEVSAEQQAAEEAARIAAEQAAAEEAARVAQSEAESEAARIAAEQAAAAEAARIAQSEAESEAARIAAEQAAAAAQAQAESQAASEAAAAQAAADAAALAQAQAESQAESQQASEEAAAAEAAKQAAAAQAVSDAAAARTQEEQAAAANQQQSTEAKQPSTEAHSEESEPVEGGKLVLKIAGASTQEAGEYAKIKAVYGLGENSPVEKVETRLYVWSDTAELPQFDENNSYTDPSSKRSFLLKVDADGDRYIEYILKAGESFKQEFLFGNSTAEAGSTVTFEVVLGAEGEIPTDNEIQKTNTTVTYTLPEAETEVPNETAVETEAPAESETVAETETPGETAVTEETVVTEETTAAEETVVTEETAAAEETQAVVENVVTFEVGEGAAVTVDGVDATNTTAMAKDGTIYFVVTVAEGYELAEVLVDGSIPARTTENAGEYIIENIKTDETVVSVSTTVVETEEEIIEEEILDDGVMMVADDEGVELYAAGDSKSYDIADDDNTISYTLLVNGKPYTPGTTVSRDAVISIKMSYSLGEINNPTVGDPKGYTYTLPTIDGLKFSGTTSGYIYGADQSAVGTYTVVDGVVTFHYYDSALVDASGKPLSSFSGTFTMDYGLDKDAAAGSDQIELTLPDGKKVMVSLETPTVSGAKSYVVDSDGNIVFTIVLTPNNGTATNVVVTDTLKGSFEFVEGSFTKSPDDGSFNQPVITTTDDGQVATIIVGTIPYGQTATITYKVKSTDAAGNLSGSNGAGIGYGTGNGSANTNDVTIDLNQNVLDKSSMLLGNNQVRYEIKVNELKLDLDGTPNSGTITLTDTLDTSVITLINGTIAIADSNGNDLLANGTARYSLDGSTLTFIVPDETSVIISYNVAAVGEIDETVEINNTVKMTSPITKEDSDYTEVKIIYSSATFVGDPGTIRFTKVGKYADGNGKLPVLQGAEFALYKVDLSSSPVNLNGEWVETVTSDGNGYVTFGENSIALQKDTLYYFVETKAPSGYIASDEKTYFYVASEDSAAFKAELAEKCSGITVHKYTDGQFIGQVSNEKIPAEVKLDFDVNKTVNGSAPSENVFKFKLTLDSYTAQGDYTSASKPEIADQIETNNGGTVDFAEITFEYEGVYTFKITEETLEGDAANNYFKDGTTYTAVVTVRRDENDRTKLIIKEGPTITPSVTDNEITFNNISKESFSLTKNTTAPVTQESVEFNFTIKASDIPTGTDLSAVTVEGAESYNVNGNTITATLKITKGNSTGTITVDGIPTGTKLTVSEGTKSGWTLTNPTSNSLDVTVSATEANTATFTNSYSTSGKWKPEGTKTLTGRPLTAGAFNFVVKEGNTTVSTGTNKANGTIEFTAIPYTEAGEHTYVISEVVPETPETNLKYDTHEITVKVTVTDDGNGKLTATADKSKSDISFTNSYTATGSWTPAASKVLTGGAQYKDSTFEFGVYDASDNEVSTGTRSGSDGSITFSEISYTQADIGKAYTYTIKEKTGNRTDIEYDDTKYTVAVKIVDRGNGVIEASDVQYSKGGETIDVSEVVFTNSYRATGQSSIRGRKILENKALEAGKYKIGLFYDQAGNNPVYVNADGYICEATAEGARQLVATNDANGNFSLLTPKYTQDDITTDSNPAKEYYVREVNTGVSGITYSSAAYKVTVTITDKAEHNGELNVAPVVENGASISFTNTYNASGTLALSAQKTVTGRSDVPSIFKFELYEIIDGVNSWKQTVENNGTGVNFTTITYTKENVPNGSATFEYLIKEQQVGPTYYGYSNEEYKVVAVVTDSGNGTFNVAKTVYKKNQDTGEFYKYTENSEVPLFTNTYTATGYATIEGVKDLQNHALSDKQFSFELYSISGYGTADRTDTLIETVKNDANGKFTFSELTFNQTQVGHNYYAVKEVNEGKAGYSYFTGEKIVDVYVTDNNNGTLTTTVTPNGISGDNKLQITNTYTATGSLQLPAKKILNGKDLIAEQFTFTLTGDDGTNQTKKNALDGTITFDALNYDQSDIGETYTYTISEVNDGAAGYTYSGDTYEVSVTIVDNHNGTLSTPHTITVKHADESAEQYKANGTETKEVEFVNEYNATGEVQIVGTKELIGGLKELSAEDFSFVISSVTVDTVTGDEIVTPLETVYNDADGNFAFKKFSYTQPGTYVYRVHEVNDAKAGYTYDTAVIEVTVTVTDNGKGKLTATPSYESHKVLDSGETEVVNADGVKFVNYYEVNKGFYPVATKVLDGHTLAAGQFSFTLRGEGVDETKTNDETGHVTFSEIKYDEGDIGKTFNYTISEVKGSAAGYTYSEEVYKLVVKVEDNNGSLTVTPKYYLSTDLEKETTAVFTNTYGAENSIVLGGTKTLTGKRALDEGIFTFQMTYDQAGKNPVYVDENNYICEATAEGATQVTATNNADGSFTFPEIKYTQEFVKANGTYTVDYYISEVKDPDDKVYTYSDVIYKVEVVVKDKNNGTLSVEKTITNLTKGETTEAIVFENHYNAKGYLDLGAEKKLVTGSDLIGLKAGQFEFELAGKGVKQVKTNSADGTVEFDRIWYTESDIGNTYMYTVAEHYGKQSGFTYSNAIYIVQVSITDNLDGTLNVETQITDRYGNEVDEMVFENEYHASGSLELEAVKVLRGKELAADQFTFELKDKAGNVLQTKSNNADGTIDFDTIPYNESAVGTHIYTISEQIPNPVPNGYTYDTTVYTVTVTVADNGNGTLNVSKVISKPGENDTAIVVEKPIFENIYGAYCELPVSATKVLTGSTLADNQFKFSLKRAGSTQEEEQIVYNTGSTVTFENLKFTQEDAGKTYTYLLREVIPSPKAAGYTYDEQVYQVVVSIEDDGDGTMTATSKMYKVTGPAGDPQKEEVKDAVFSNEYHAAGELNLTATKVLTGRDLEAGQFTFTLENAEGTPEVSDEQTNDANGLVVFNAIEYTEKDAGQTYTYTVKETNAGKSGYIYDETVYTVTAYIKDNGAGTLTPEVTIKAGETKVDGITFNNVYEAKEEVVLTATKNLAGTTIRDGLFSFTLTGHGLNQTKPNVGTSVTFDKITYSEADAGKDFIYTISEVIPADEDKIPGYSYDTTTYEVKVSVRDNGDGSLDVTKEITKISVTDEGTVRTEADAVEFNNTYKVECELNLTATKKLTGRDLEAEQFTFTLTNGENTPAVSQEKTNSADGEVVFDAIKYTEADAGNTYTYTVKESVPANKAAGYTYDETEYTVTVTINDDGEGTLTPEVVINDGAVTAIEFENTYKAEGKIQLTATKNLEGRAIADNQFEFMLSGQDIEAQTKRNDGTTVTFDEIIYGEEDAGKDFVYTISEVIPDVKAPGYSYDETEYKVTVSVSDNGDGTLEAKVTKITLADKEVDAVVFNNTYVAEGELELTATKALSGRTIENGQFKFSLKGIGNEGDTNADQEVSNIGNTVTFAKLKYTQKDAGKTYVYRMQEVIPEEKAAGYVYDESVYQVEVSVTDNGNGTVTAVPTFYKITGTAADPKKDEVDGAVFNNEYHAAGELNLTATKALAGRDLEAEQFTFTLESGENTPAFSQEKTNNAAGVITFDTIKYTEEDAGKTYTYTVQEIDAEADGYTYDETVYTVTVKVKDNGDGTLTPVVKYEADETETDAIRFSNTYEAGGEIILTATKNLEGRKIADGQFKFKLVGPNTDEQIKSNVGTNVTFDAIEYSEVDAGKDYVYTISEVIPDVKAPGYTYDETTYKVTVSVRDNGDGTLDAKVTKITAADEVVDAVEFNNIYEAKGDITLTAEKILKGRAIEDGQFKFSLKGINNEGDTNADQEVSNVGETVTFGKLEYTEKDAGKTYTYELQEVIPADEDKAPGYTYDTTVYTVTIDVTDNGNGTLKVEKTISTPGENEAITVENAVFQNEYNAEGGITLEAEKKYAEGVQKDLEDGRFEFVVTENGEEVASASNAGGKVVFTEIEYVLTPDDQSVLGTHTYVVTEVAGTETTVYYDDAEYTVTVEVTDNGDGTLKSEITDITCDEETKDDITFVNDVTKVRISKTDIMNSEELPGAELEVRDAEGVVIDSWTSGTETHYIEDVLEIGKIYTLVETAAPDGYTIANEMQFYVAEDGLVYTADDELIADGTVVMEDEPIRIEITKTGFTKDGEVVPLQGAKMEIREKTEAGEIGDIVYNVYGEKMRFESATEAVALNGVKPGTYWLVELEAPEGYMLADPIEFTINEDMTVSQNPATRVMKDCPIVVEISKVDITNNEELPGAKLQVLDKDGKQVVKTIYGEELSWTSTSTPRTFTGLPAGDYILREIAAPDGYAIAKDVAFTITSDLTVVNKVVMEDAPTEVIISKTKLTGTKELEGAQLQVLDATGKVAKTIYGEELSWTSGQTAKEIKGLPTGTYTLHEVLPPEGYAYAEDITFEVTNDGAVTKLVMKDDTTKVTISKMDVTNNKELAGAHLILKDAQGEIVAEWTSTGKPKELNGKLIAGAEYTLTEITAPVGYDIAKDITFTVNTDGTINKVVMDDKVSDGKGSVTVQKLVMQDGNFFAVDYTFYTALFADEACTQRVTSVKPLIVNGSYTTSTIFTNLQYGTYYVAETDEYGNAISEALMIESIDIIDGTAVLTPAQATAKSTIINHVAGFDGGYYNDGQIKVNKTVLVNGVEEKVTDTFYFALFTDAGLTMMYDAGVQKLKLKNESSGSVTFKNLPYGSYYLAETDKNGNPVDADFEYTVTISSSYCSLDAENRTVERDVINSRVEQPDGTTTTTTTTTTGTTTSTTSTGATTTTSVKTGDETPVAPYAAAMALSAAVLALVSLMEKKRRRSR